MTTFTPAALGGILDQVGEEVERACQKFPPMHGPHEGYAVILEEVDELWEEVRANRGRQPEGAAEALQVAAMAVRYLLDLFPSESR